MGWIKKQIASFFLGDTVGSVVRGLLKALGGFLVAKGVASAEQADNLTLAIMEIIPGVLSFIIGQLISFKAAKK